MKSCGLVEMLTCAVKELKGWSPLIKDKLLIMQTRRLYINHSLIFKRRANMVKGPKGHSP